MSYEHVYPKASQLDTLNRGIFHISRALGGAGLSKTFYEEAQEVEEGISLRVPGEVLHAYMESSVSVTIVGSNITAAEVDDLTFTTAVDSTATHAYEFTYDGAAWHLHGEEVELAEYGITITGTPADGDAIVVHVVGTQVDFEVLDMDKDIPANSNYSHSLTLATVDLLNYNAIPFSNPQALKAIAADEFPNGLEADGRYYLTLDHGAYNNTTTQDGDYYFIPTIAVPVGGKIRHTAIGVYQSDGSYTPEKILAGKFITYDANYNELERCTTYSGAVGTSLGTATAESKTYMVGSHLNATLRQGHGSNRYAHNAQRKWMNSNAAAAASGEIASWWYASDEFDMPVRSTLPGLLHTLDPALVAVIAPVRKRTYLHPWDQDGAAYEDTEELVFQLSMTEVGFGANSGVNELSPNADGTLTDTQPYALYQGATNADRIKYLGTDARYWWLRSPNPSYAHYERRVNTDGSLRINYASISYGAVAGLCIIRNPNH